jgi:hypothetical protein
VRILLCLTAVVAWLVSPALNHCAYAQTHLSASYTISLLGVTVGAGGWELEINGAQYLEKANGRISGMASRLISGEGSASTRGVFVGNRAQPATFEANVKTDAETDNIKMTFDNTNIVDLIAEPPLPQSVSNRVPVAEADLKGVLDPLSALLATADSDEPKPQICENRLPIFDGRRRYDVALSFKRMDTLKAGTGYQGPVVVCSVHIVPISGHRTGRSALRLLVKSDDIEVALAPLAGTRLWAPFQAAIPTAVGTVWITAEKFVVAGGTPNTPSALQR